jgi:TRAP-type C4-dicarboxylate transport system substrate-binding protein
MATLSIVAGQAPVLEGADLPGLSPNAAQSEKLGNALVPAANDQLEKLGIKLIATFPYAGQVFYCKPTINSLNDLRGKKVREVGKVLGDFISSFGAQPVNIDFASVYSALSSGVADCAVTGTSSGNSAKWYEVTHTLYMLTVTWAVAGYFVDLKWWNSLKPDVRDYLDATLKEMAHQQSILANDLTQDGLSCNLGKDCKYGTAATEKPMVAVQPSSADLEALKAAVQKSSIPDYVKDCGSAVNCGDVFNKYLAPIAGVQYNP